MIKDRAAHYMTDSLQDRRLEAINEKKRRAFESISLQDQPLDIVVVIPVYNETHRLDDIQEKVELAETISAISNGNINLDFVLVDEGSTDGTSTSLTNLFGENNKVTITAIPSEIADLKHNPKAPETVAMGAAIAYGFKYVQENLPNKSHVIYTDADGSVPLWELGNALSQMKTSDVVVGSRREHDSITVRNEKVQSYGSQFIKIWKKLFPKLGNIINDTNGPFQVWNLKALKVVSNWCIENRLFSPAFKTASLARAVDQEMGVSVFGITFIDDPDGSRFSGDDALKRLTVYSQILKQLAKISNTKTASEILASDDKDLLRFIINY